MPNDPSRRNIRRRDTSSDPTVSIPKITPDMVEQARRQAGAQPAAKPWERDRLAAQQAAQGMRRNRRSDARPVSGVKVIDTTIMPPVQAPAADAAEDSGPSVAELSARAVREVQAARAREAAQAAAPAQPAQPTPPIRRAEPAGGTARPAAPAARERSLQASSMTAEFSAAAVQAGLRQQPAASARPAPAARERSLQASSMTAEFSTAAVLEGLRSRQAAIPNEPTMPAPPSYPTARPMPHAPTHVIQSRRQFTGLRPVAPPPEPVHQTPQETLPPEPARQTAPPAPERPAPQQTPTPQPVSRPAPRPTAAAVRPAPAVPPVRPVIPAAPARRRSGPTRAQAEAALYRSIHDDHLWLNNPVMVRGLGLAPVIVAAVNGRSALLLCAAAALLLTATRVLAVALCHLTGHRQRPLFYALSAAVAYIPAYAILYAIFGSELSLLGIYLPLLAVDPAIIKRMEAPELESLGDAFSRGINNTLGLCLALMLTGTLRELLSVGSVFGVQMMADPPLPLAAQPAGGFLFVGLLAGLWTAVGGAYVHYKREEVRELYGES